MASTTRLRAPSPGEVLYPESDGKPMGETDEHRYIINYLIEALRLWYRRAPDVYASGNLMMYYVPDDTNVSLSPDVFVVKGVPKRQRRVFKVWEEGKAPTVVIEVSSRKTRSEDLGEKLEVYRDIFRVREYYIYDPLREYLPARLRAWERKGSRFVERRLSGGRFISTELGLELHDRDGCLRLIDPATGAALPDLEQAEDRRHAAEAEVRRLREEIARLRAKRRPGLE
ncbi:MAG: Uma2 family endonuclease [Planctomycetes bacterium]|nr:Uma2 family endonuclease [Planctomycetota bacterium]